MYFEYVFAKKTIIHDKFDIGNAIALRNAAKRDHVWTTESTSRRDEATNLPKRRSTCRCFERQGIIDYDAKIISTLTCNHSVETQNNWNLPC